ncbi:unnamed protein product, partial [marine sediment metagenome]
MATFVTDIIEGHSVNFDASGYTCQRIYRVSGVSGTDGHARIYNTMIDVNIPAYGAVHPTITDIYVISKE